MDELNCFSHYAWSRIYGDDFVFWNRFLALLKRCGYTGSLFPADALMYAPWIRQSGILRHRLKYDAALFRFISHCELVHFGWTGSLPNDETPWKLDIPLASV